MFVCNFFFGKIIWYFNLFYIFLVVNNKYLRFLVWLKRIIGNVESYICSLFKRSIFIYKCLSMFLFRLGVWFY